MPIAFVADVHVGQHRKWGAPSRGRLAPVNARCRDTVAVLADARRRAETAGCTDLFVLGDLFDTSCPSPQEVAEVVEALSTTSMVVHLMVGNHDQVSDAAGDHAMVSMAAFGDERLLVYERPTVVYRAGFQVVLVPYRPGYAKDYLESTVEEVAATADPLRSPTVRLLGLHLGLEADDTPPWLRGAHDSIRLDDLARAADPASVDLVLAGNWHEHKVYGDYVQVGALVPTGFDNPGWDGYGSLLVVTDGGEWHRYEVPGPRFLRAPDPAAARQHLERASREPLAYPVYLSVRCRLDQRGDVRELMELYDHKEYEVLASRAAEEDAAEEVRASVQYASTDSIEAAVRAYVSAMALPDDVDRARVEAMAVDYVAGSAQ